MMHEHLKKLIDEDIENYQERQSHLLSLVTNMKRDLDYETVSIRTQKGKIEALTRDFNNRMIEENKYLETIIKDHQKMKETIDYANEQLGIKAGPPKVIMICQNPKCKRNINTLKGLVCPHCRFDNSPSAKPAPLGLPAKEEPKDEKKGRKKITKLVTKTVPIDVYEDEIPPTPEGKK